MGPRIPPLEVTQDHRIDRMPS